jgi:hypothetical protein
VVKSLRRYPAAMAAADDIVELTSVHAEFQAEVIAAALRDRGIEARVLGGTLAGFRAEVPATVKVVVFRRDLSAAKALLAEVRAASVDIDWDEVDVGRGEPGPGEMDGGPEGRDGGGSRGGGVGRALAAKAERRAFIRGRTAVVALALAGLLASFALRLPAGVVLAMGAVALLAVAWATISIALHGPGRVDPFDRSAW